MWPVHRSQWFCTGSKEKGTRPPCLTSQDSPSKVCSSPGQDSLLSPEQYFPLEFDLTERIVLSKSRRVSHATPRAIRRTIFRIGNLDCVRADYCHARVRSTRKSSAQLQRQWTRRRISQRRLDLRRCRQSLRHDGLRRNGRVRVRGSDGLRHGVRIEPQHERGLERESSAQFQQQRQRRILSLRRFDF